MSRSNTPRPHILRNKALVKKRNQEIRKETDPDVFKLNEDEETTNSAPGQPIMRKVPDEVKLEEFEKTLIMNPLLRAVHKMNWKKPTAIQNSTIPVAIKGHNIVASARTGTGKTAAYVLPMLHRLHIILESERKKRTTSLSRHSRKRICRSGISRVLISLVAAGTMKPRVATPLVLILCPSTELAEQVMEQTYQLASNLPAMRVMGLYGALKNKSIQEEALREGVDILISTPGRLITLMKENVVYSSHLDSQMEAFQSDEDDDILMSEEDDDFDFDDEDIETDMNYDELSTVHDSNAAKSEKMKREGLIDLSSMRMFVLDEVDRMLDMGHMPSIKTIFKSLPRRNKQKSRQENMQVMMVTATLVPQIMVLLSRFAPRNVLIDQNWDMKTSDTLKKVAYYVNQLRKRALLEYLLRRKGSLRGKKVMVFCRTKQRVKNLMNSLAESKFNVACIHTDQSLSIRQNTVEDFRRGKYHILIATDLMARGIDIPDLDAVVNYDVPHLPQEYIHRIGRAGRAGREGKAITLVSKRPILKKIAKRVVSIGTHLLLAPITHIADEKRYIKNIERLLDEKVHFSKVPGPWKDNDHDVLTPEGNPVEVPEWLLREAEQRRQELIAKHKRIVAHAAKRNDVRRASTEEKQSYALFLRREIKLEDIPEGRFEVVLNQLERKAARKQGVVVPQSFDKMMADLEMRRAQRREERRLKLEGKFDPNKLNTIKKAPIAKPELPFIDIPSLKGVPRQTRREATPRANRRVNLPPPPRRVEEESFRIKKRHLDSPRRLRRAEMFQQDKKKKLLG